MLLPALWLSFLIERWPALTTGLAGVLTKSSRNADGTLGADRRRSQRKILAAVAIQHFSTDLLPTFLWAQLST